MEKVYDHHSIEKKWNNRWGETKIFNPWNQINRSPFYFLLSPPQKSDFLDTDHIIDLSVQDIIFRRIKMQKSQFPESESPHYRVIKKQKDLKSNKTGIETAEVEKIINKFGSDAFKFTLAVQAGPSGDISLSINQLKGYRAFTNKIWNASRYVIMNLQGNENLNIDNTKITPVDKWFLHSLNNITDKISHLMDQHIVNEAADKLYHFFWHEFCRWYLEYSKINIQKLECRKVLKLSLLHLIQLLHPFIPYITEEIYQRLSSGEDFLLEIPLPGFDSKMAFPKEYSAVEQLKNIITETRKTRAENKIDPNKKIQIYLKSNSKQKRITMAHYLKYYNFLTSSNKTQILDDFSNDLKGFRGKISGWGILIPFENNSERIHELTKLKREFKAINNQIHGMEAKLMDQQYIKKTSGAGLSVLKKNLLIKYEKREKIQKTICDLT
ncbi:MAG: class I tRNA ligase family protein [Candidatus Aminicenantes bacterium]|nr:class I tRNA ligase family protein [Candidatus Aminicenantes bacterium]